MLNVTETFLPDINQYIEILKEAWDKKWITNNGSLVVTLEEQLKKYLGVKHLLFTTNGTIVLQMALKSLKAAADSEIITTPFSYVATTNAILWEGLQPVFVDINAIDYTIDVTKIEAAITPKTVAILATHVYGNPCDVKAIDIIAKKYNLKVIYDAAHTFAATYEQKHILQFGDIATCSFHATKVFHTVEGGCITTNDDAIAKDLYLMRQFGHIGDAYYSVGINAKNSEFHAAMGICNLLHLEEILDARQKITALYDSLFSTINISKPIGLVGTQTNYSYYIVRFSDEQVLTKVKKSLENNTINTRRYFYPSLNTLPMLKNHQHCPISEEISKAVLALPLSASTTETDVYKVFEIIKQELC